MTDYIYFGKDTTDERFESQRKQGAFTKAIKEKFPSINVIDDYDSIKGFQVKVSVFHDDDHVAYYAFLIGNGWHESSQNIKIYLSGQESILLKDALELAVELYGENIINEFRKRLSIQ